MITWLPSRCSDSAKPRPMPVPPPVTSTVLPIICIAVLLRISVLVIHRFPPESQPLFRSGAMRGPNDGANDLAKPAVRRVLVDARVPDRVELHRAGFAGRVENMDTVQVGKLRYQPGRNGQRNRRKRARAARHVFPIGRLLDPPIRRRDRSYPAALRGRHPAARRPGHHRVPHRPTRHYGSGGPSASTPPVIWSRSSVASGSERPHTAKSACRFLACLTHGRPG